MLTPKEFAQNKALSIMLSENFSPVGRMRLMGSGLQPNNRLAGFGADGKGNSVSDKGCLACGNCIDNCPVVREKERFEFRQNRRTSMSLEAIVGDDCRRCYRCVKACPQVSKEVKEYVWGFRRTEKFIHATMATAIFTLMCTGIFLYHYREFIPQWQSSFIGGFHALAGLLLGLVPLLFWLLARDVMKRTLKKAWHFEASDKEWLLKLKDFLRHPVGKTLPEWREFNPYHKFWICWLSVVIPVLFVTGVCNFLGEGVLGHGFYTFMYGVHALAALGTDLLVLTHLYFKLLRWIIRMLCDMWQAFRKTKKFDYPFLYSNTQDK